MAFIKLTRIDGSECTVNTANITTLEEYDSEKRAEAFVNSENEKYPDERDGLDGPLPRTVDEVNELREQAQQILKGRTEIYCLNGSWVAVRETQAEIREIANAATVTAADLPPSKGPTDSFNR